MSVTITNRAKKNIREFYWRSCSKSIQRKLETKSLLGAMLKLIYATPLIPSKESRGILDIWKRKGYTIYETTHYFVRKSDGIECKPMTSKNSLKRKWYFACVIDLSNNNVYVVNAVYYKYIDRLIDDTPTAVRFMRAMKGVFTRKKKKEAENKQMNINFPENKIRKDSNKIFNNSTKIQNDMKQVIRLTEGDLRRMIKNSVNEALNELDWKTYASAADKAEQDRQCLLGVSPYGTPAYKKYIKRYNQGFDFLDAASNALSKKYGRNYNIYRGRDNDKELYDGDKGWTKGDEYEGPEPLGYISTIDKNYNLSDEDWQDEAKWLAEYLSEKFPWETDKQYAQRQKKEWEDFKASKELDDFYQGKNKYHKGEGWR